MNKTRREVYLVLSRLPIAWFRWSDVDSVEPVAPGRAWGTPWMDSPRSGWDCEETAVVDWWGASSLCYFCRYARWDGSCEDTELTCEHPLAIVSEQSDNVWSGDDCWGFRPMLPLDAIVEFASQRMQGEDAGIPTKAQWKETKTHV